METAVIKKRLSTFKSSKGMLKRVSDDVVMEVLRGWESWSGSSADFYREIGLSKQQMANMIKKGKNLVKTGVVTEGEFREISLPTGGAEFGAPNGATMEVRLDAGKAIKFFQVDQLVDFLKKMS